MLVDQRRWTESGEYGTFRSSQPRILEITERRKGAVSSFGASTVDDVPLGMVGTGGALGFGKGSQELQPSRQRNERVIVGNRVQIGMRGVGLDDLENRAFY